MTAKRWVGFSLVLLGMMTWSRIAAATITMTPDPVAVGSVLVGSSTSVNGSLSSDVNGVNVDVALTATCTGTGTGTFMLSSAAGLTNLNLNAAKTITVGYMATTRGARSCTVNVLDTGTSTVLSTFQVSATGVAPVVSAPASLTFAATRWSTGATAAQTLTITNNGDTGQDLSIVSLMISGTDAADFTVTAGPVLPTTITPGMNKQWTVTMDPSAGGVRSATLTIASNDPLTSMKTVSLSGTGTNAMIAVTDVTFPNAVAGGTPVTGSITVANTASSDVGTLTGTAAVISQTSTWFSFGTGSGCTSGTTSCTLTSFTMPPSKTIPVRCAPPSGQTGTQTATVTVTNDSDPGGDSVAMMSCTATQHATANPTSLAYGDVEVGKTSATQMLTVTNTGGANLTISDAGLLANTSQYTVTGTTGAQTTILAPDATATWMINCHPTSQGSKNTSFRVVSNSDGVAGTNLDVPVTCNGQQGVLVIAATSYNFGGVRELFTATQTFTLSNTGNVAVTNITATLDAKLLGFSITTPTFPISLAPGAMTTVTVRFAPQNGTDGCAITMAGDCTIRFTGDWGVTPTTTTATLTVLGDGLITGYDTSPSAPNALDIGNVRFDQTGVGIVNVINTAGSLVQIRGFTITPGTAMTGEFAVTRCRHNSLTITCPTMIAPFSSSGTNDTLVVDVTCDPNNRVAMLDATLTVYSDLMSNPNRTVPLKCNSTTAGLGVDPMGMVVDFGPTDLDVVPVSVQRTVTLTNTGVAPLTLGAGVKTGAFYVTTAMPGASIAPGGTYPVTVTYTPTVERPSNQPDTGSIYFPITGVLGSPGSVTIALTGYGVDRHIAVAPAPTFPDTFTDVIDGPVMPVTVTNNGDADLWLSAVMLTNDPIWTLQPPDNMFNPVKVAGRQSYSFMVKFSPSTAGKAPVGHLSIINTDNGMMMVAVDLNGNGMDRNIRTTPRDVNFGYSAVGVPVRMSELRMDGKAGTMFEVANLEAVQFMINGLTIAGGNGAFAIVDQDGNPIPTAMEIAMGTKMPIALPSQTIQKFDIVFTPAAEGDYSATVSLNLENARELKDIANLRGSSLYVDAGGGGGCSTGGGAGGAMIAVVLALLLAMRRRRVLAPTAVMIVIVGAQPSWAEDTRNVSLSVFDPTPATVGTSFHVQDASVADAGDFAATALVSYVSDPLVLRPEGTNNDVQVTNRTTLAIGGVYAFTSTLEAGLHMPLYIQSGAPAVDNTVAYSSEPGSGTVRGDLTLHGKLQLGVAAGGQLAYGVGAALTLPTATDDQFAGTDLPAGRALLLISWSKQPVTITVNAGGIVRAKSTFHNLNQGSGATWGAAGTYRVLDQLWLDAEIFGDLLPGGRTLMGTTDTAMASTIEALGGLRYQLARTTSIGVAGGRGVTRGFGSPALRAALTLSFTPGAGELAPLRAPRPPQPAKDSDGDGVTDELDACPNEPEDRDQFDDTDGCPDPDNDRDGIPDVTDKCPLHAEDKDGFEDTNGCPDTDNDFDGIPDGKDKCPSAAEDGDGFEDADGCPEPDNDRDGLLDTIDKCPNQAETINGTDDDDGCPDKGMALVVVSPDRLEILESVQFSGPDTVAKSSRNVVGQIGATLRAHPEIRRVRVTVHVQPTSDPRADQKLSEARAKALKDWLVDWGIDSLRLQSSGFGGSKPLVPANSRGAQQINDRVELIVLERR